MDGCLVDHPDIAAAARDVGAVASFLGIQAWDERSRIGDLRYVWLKTDGRGAVLVTLITASRETRAKELADALPNVAGVAWCVQASDGNAIRGEDIVVLRGRDTLEVELAGVRVEVGPLGFLQPNPRVAELAYADLCASPVPPLVFDLYAGAGVTTELLRRAGARVLACEAYAESAARLGVEPESAEAFLARVAAEGLVPGLVVANPPRAGLGSEVCEALARLAGLGLEKIRIMSCGPAGLKADLDRLASTFALTDLRAYDTLPHTPHIELVATLHARSGSR
jgi:tRNA/tmRNA/rRNA uracil-C5-methylase (TrmA/RlmC/RlmD family)